jgi:hypothetical protein
VVNKVFEMNDVILGQTELIARQTDVINRQIVEIGQMKQQIDALVDSINWYENETKHNATFEKLRCELEVVQAENTLLKGEIDILTRRVHKSIRG